MLPIKEQLEQGGAANPFWIAGPCVIESRETMALIADRLQSISNRLKIPVVFKASFDKANRSSAKSPRGPGMEEGLKVLEWIKKEFGLLLLTDIHECHQAAPVAEVVDILQIPAFLCRQTDLLEAAAKTGRAVNVKKGQFLAPQHVKEVVEKLKAFGAPHHWITERGSSFGYQRLVVDFTGFETMKKHSSLIFDITHSVQLPGSEGGVTGGMREAIPDLAVAGAAIGVSGFFAETHPTPERSLSDAANAWPLDKLEWLMGRCQKIAQIAHGK